MLIRSLGGRILAVLIVVSLGSGVPLVAQAPVPVGDEFQVNTYTLGRQHGPSVSVSPLGDFLVVWEGAGGIRGQRFERSGMPVGAEFQVDPPTIGPHRWPRAVLLEDGEFVVVWQADQYLGNPTVFSIIGQRFSALGAMVGEEFQVNLDTTGDHWHPSIDETGDGEFIVVWEASGPGYADNSSLGILGRRLDSSATPIGVEFQVNAYTTGKQEFPFVAGSSSGDFVVVWQSQGSYGTDTSISSIQGQRFDDLGAPIGSQFQVNTYTTSYQRAPAVDIGGDGSFVVVWDSVGSYGSDTDQSVQGQRFDGDGLASGGQFQINTFTNNQQRRARVGITTDGSFVVVWRSRGSFSLDHGYSVQGQRFDPSGLPSGSQFKVNTYAYSYQWFPEIGAGLDGEFVVVWMSAGSYGTDNSESSIQGQRFATPIFADGFESGDASAWSGIESENP